MSREERDKKNKRVGIIISGVAHVLILVLFIFLVAWRAPNPPLPEFGIELNFGTSSQGSGEEQPEPFTAPAETDSEEDAPETPVDEVIEEITDPVEDISEEVTEPIEETTEEVIEDTEVQEEVTPVTDIPTEAPVVEPEKKEEVKEEPIEKVVEEKPKELPKVLYPGTKDGTADEAKKANQGDKTDAVGDQGDKEGDVDARALYGTAGGGGGGAALEMAGWMWDNPPDPKETTSQEGNIVFEITIDERGNVVSARPISYTVSISLVKIYQAEVERLTFSKTGSGIVEETTKGQITFKIQTK